MSNTFKLRLINFANVEFRSIAEHPKLYSSKAWPPSLAVVLNQTAIKPVSISGNVKTAIIASDTLAAKLCRCFGCRFLSCFVLLVLH